MKEKEKHYYYIHPDSMSNGFISVFGITKEDNSFLQASIRDLQLDVMGQERMLELNIHPDGQLFPTGEKYTVVVQEGVFEWDWEIKDYKKIE